MPILSFMIYNLFNTLTMYSYLLLTRSFVSRLELPIFRKPRHFMCFILLSAVVSLSNFGYKFYLFIPGFLHLIISFGCILSIFIFTKFSNKISWLKAFLCIVLFTSFSIGLDALCLYGISLLGIDFETIYVFLQYFGALFYAAICFSIALIIDYHRSQKQKNRLENMEISSIILPDLNRNHYFFIMLLFVIYIFYVAYLTSYNIKNLALLASSNIFLLSIAFLIIFYMFLRQNKKHYQSLYIKRLENEAYTLANYAKTVDSLYTDIRHYKHDIQNVLLSMRLYIDKNNMDVLREFYYSEVLLLSPVNNPVYQIITNLQPLKHISLKGLICSKIEDFIKNNISFQVEILETIEEISINAVDLCRIVGILLDNGIESACESDDRQLILSMDVQNNTVIFAVQNTFKEKPELDKIYQLNYSTKGSDRGVGLHSLSSIISKNKNISLSYKLDDKFFCHVIEIQNL